MRRILATLAALPLVGCAYDYDTHRPDLYPGAEHTITVPGDGLDVVDLYDGAPGVWGDGVECDYTITETASAASVSVRCFDTAATEGLIPSRILDVMDGDTLRARIILDGRR